MMLFIFKVKDKDFPQIFEGGIEADSIEDALQLVKEEYAAELGTMPEEIRVIEIRESHAKSGYFTEQ